MLKDTVLRYAASLLVAVVVTGSLLLLMHSLITFDEQPWANAPPAPKLQWVRMIEEDPIEGRRPPKPPDEVEPPPDVPPLVVIDSFGGGLDVEMDRPDAGPDVEIGGRMVDGDMLPLVKVAPVYPASALNRGIEGFVLVRFTVTAAGAVAEPEIVEASPQGIFERAALTAVERFRYRPRVVAGEAMAVSGVMARIVFELEGR